MSTGFSEQDYDDLKEIFRIYDFSKVDQVNDVVADAEKKGTLPTELFDSLYALYKIRKLPQREAVARRLHMAVTTASDADVESVLRQTEMKGFSERDAARSLERKYNVQHFTSRSLQAARNNLNSPHDGSTGVQSELLRTTSQLRHVTVNESSSTSTMADNTSTNMVEGGEGDEKSADGGEASVIVARPPSRLSAAPTRENLDEIVSEEVREWLAKMLGDTYNSDVLAMPNFIDALRNGVLLHVLLQKMQDPPVADADLKLPKRSTGFFIRDNVATFLKEAKKRFNLVDAQLFTDSDLVDGKSDRQVVTCLMAMARIAYSTGTIKLAPNIIMYEHEIEQQGTHLTNKDLDRIVNEAEAVEDQAIPALQQDVEPAAEVAEGTNGASANRETEGVDEVAQTDTDKNKTGEARSSPAPQTSDEVEEAKDASFPAQETSAKAEGENNSSCGGAAPPATNNRTPQKALLHGARLDISPSAAADRTLGSTTLETSRDYSATPKRGSDAPEDEATSSAPATMEDNTAAAPAGASHLDSPRPCSEDLHTPAESGLGPAETVHTSSVEKNTNHDNVKSRDESNEGDGSDDNDGTGGGRVFYLRDGALRQTRPTLEEELELREHRKKAAPRVVWKSPCSPLAATKPPLYHSRHWDGIDIALGRHLNAHYDQHPQSPWRFHMVASTSGEYVLYNRLNAQKRVVYLRIIQARLFFRNAGRNQPWVRIEEALKTLENSP